MSLLTKPSVLNFMFCKFNGILKNIKQPDQDIKAWKDPEH